MPINFTCPSCDALLRVPEGTEGKEANCPHCGSNSRVPSSPGSGSAGGSGHDSAYAATAATSSEQAENPYATPQYVDTAAEIRPPAGGERTGPPWERDGASVGSFFETVKLVFTQTNSTFTTMRRRGGIGAPMMFGIAGGAIGGLIGALFEFLQQITLGGAAIAFGPAELLLGAACVVVLLPAYLALAMLIGAGIYHVMLLMLGGANYDYEATFRVVAYCTGAAGLLSAIPWVGDYINLVCQVVFVIIGLSKTQEIRSGKASAAVLIPLVVCLAAFLAAVMAIVYTVLDQGGFPF